MKARVGVVERFYENGWTVEFAIGNQYFRLSFLPETEQDAEWMAEQLIKALGKITSVDQKIHRVVPKTNKKTRPQPVKAKGGRTVSGRAGSAMESEGLAPSSGEAVEP